MSTTARVVVRRVRPTSGERVRELRLEALRDPDAAIAFLDDLRRCRRASRTSSGRQRAAAAAAGETAAQFVGGRRRDAGWAALTGLVARAGALDHLGRTCDDATRRRRGRLRAAGAARQRR